MQACDSRLMPLQIMCRLMRHCYVGKHKSIRSSEMSKHGVHDERFQAQLRHEKLAAAGLATADANTVECDETKVLCGAQLMQCPVCCHQMRQSSCVASAATSEGGCRQVVCLLLLVLMRLCETAGWPKRTVLSTQKGTKAPIQHIKSCLCHIRPLMSYLFVASLCTYSRRLCDDATRCHRCQLGQKRVAGFAKASSQRMILKGTGGVVVDFPVHARVVLKSCTGCHYLCQTMCHVSSHY